MNLNSIPAFQDNYIWVLTNDEGRCVIIDPGEAAPVLKAIAEHKWMPEAIFLTHHHHDHVGGVKELLQHFPQMTVYGPAENARQGSNPSCWRWRYYSRFRREIYSFCHAGSHVRTRLLL
ncbi:hydroxyacylglutathione hydrolase [Salmonella enterica subsp. enterica]|uniref:Hydroxyacylglutathione hydrolase n=1 Tax=Salmonella enterica I TaxID=59201 RepID=A0A447U9J6_SALET|nr:hydroxyacylglutathione hydrolase [Salmonella enterica subsp. enterica]